MRDAGTGTGRSRYGPVLRFVGLFLGLLALVQIAYYQFVIGSAAFRAYMGLTASIAGAVLGALGEPVTVDGMLMRSHVSMSLKTGCDGLQAMALVVIGILAFPVEARKKLPGIALGIGLILALNAVRIVSLFWALAHAPGAFQALHVHVWPAVLVLVAVLFWVAWARRATR